jgi:hypothetical protein
LRRRASQPVAAVDAIVIPPRPIVIPARARERDGAPLASMPRSPWSRVWRITVVGCGGRAYRRR